jgi:hypothetical protein
MTLAQEIVTSLVFPVIEILAIENDKLDSTFLHVAFRSQSLLKPTSDQTSSDTNCRTGEGDPVGGDEWEPSTTELGLCPKIDLTHLSSNSV